MISHADPEGVSESYALPTEPHTAIGDTTRQRASFICTFDYNIADRSSQQAPWILSLVVK